MPAAVVAVSAPAIASSGTPQDVIVDSSCYGVTILGIGMSFPQFTITAVGAPIGAGSTFLLSGTGLGNLTIGGMGGFFDFEVIGGNSIRVTISEEIPAGGSATIRVTGMASAQALRYYTLSVENILINRNDELGNDSASASLSGVSFLGVLVGYCGTGRSTRALSTGDEEDGGLRARNEQRIEAMGEDERVELVSRIEALRTTPLSEWP
ncbi:hypothetical protein [Brachybacterium hainanense]|uniref:IPT/TIG domain-containing protein n=1 Tax=Brachybacterium hainanense TaxID=1541174 RepID=A0ABV6RA72_9MICO